MAVRGYAVGESAEIFQRAYELLEADTPASKRMRVMGGLCVVRFHRGEFAAALSLAKENIKVARIAGHSLELAHCHIGQVLAAMGEFEEAQRHFQEVIDAFRAGRCANRSSFLVYEPVLAFANMSRILWSLGRPEKAMAAAEEAIKLAREGTNSISLATALIGRLFLASHRFASGGWDHGSRRSHSVLPRA
jgi:tetratricopeptide (TPR) repeat protein